MLWDFSDTFVTFDLPYFFWDGSGGFEVHVRTGVDRAAAVLSTSTDGLPAVWRDQPKIELGVYL